MSWEGDRSVFVRRGFGVFSWGVRLALILVVASLGPTGGGALAKPAAIDRYPWATVMDSDVRVLPSVRLEMAARLELIARAERSIDLVIYEQKFDDKIGKPILSALRDAAERGVRVRIATAWLASFVKDRDLEAVKYMTQPAPRVPVEYFVFGGSGMATPGWGLDVSVHEKFLIVDRKVVLTTGRGHSDDYMNWLDTAYLLKGSLVNQTIQVVDNIFREIRQETKAYPSRPRAPGEIVPQYLAPAELSPTAAEEQEQAENMGWIADLFMDRESFVADPARRGRILHFDFIGQYRALAKKGVSVPHETVHRVPYFDDPVVQAVMEKLPKARDVRITMLSVILRPDLRRALKAAAKKGTRITILANGKTAKLEPANMPWRTALVDMINLLSLPNVKIYGLEKGPGFKWEYLHRKLAILDDTVFIGSHNLNLPSSTNNDEATYEIESPALAAQLGKLFDESLRDGAKPMNREALLADLPYSLHWMIVGRRLLGTF